MAVIGGLVTATVLTLVVLPILYDQFAVLGSKAAPSRVEQDCRAAKPAAE